MMRRMEQEDHYQGEYCSQSSLHYNLKSYHQDQLLFHQHSPGIFSGVVGGGGASGGSGRGGLIYPEVSPMLPWPLNPIHTFNPCQSREPHVMDPFLLPSPPPYGGLLNRRAASPQQYAGDGLTSNHPRIISDTLGLGALPGSAAPFGLQAELGEMTAQEIMDAKALAASKSHSEAERRRRERINNHLAKLRSLLPSTTKTDKASLLAEVIQHVKELRRQTSLIAETSPIPTEIDELMVDASDEDGKSVIKASICCEDRPNLLPELIKTLKSMRLRTLKAEITTLGGRVKNVLFITGEEDSSCNSRGDQQRHQQPMDRYSISSIQEALRAVMEKPGGSGAESSSASAKRQRTNNVNIIEHRPL